MTAMPAPPPPDDEALRPASGPMPSSVANAQKLVFVYIVLTVIQTILAFVAADALVDAYAESTGSELPTEFLRESTPAYGAIALISLIVVGGLLLASALNFPKRASWARIVALVFGILGALGGLISVFQPSPIWYKLLLIVAGLVALGITVLLFQEPSRRWFSATR